MRSSTGKEVLRFNEYIGCSDHSVKTTAVNAVIASLLR